MTTTHGPDTEATRTMRGAWSYWGTSAWAYDTALVLRFSRDPIGERGGFNLYAFVWNSPVDWIDPLGLFSDGTPDGFKGHGQFTTPNGGGRDSDFDFTAQDYGPNNPIDNPDVHFQDKATSEAQVRAAIEACDNKAFANAMHNLQDFYSHKNKGYSWEPSSGKFGHLLDFFNPFRPSPDNDNNAWDDAEANDKQWNDLWNKTCVKCHYKWGNIWPTMWVRRDNRPECCIPVN